MRQFENSHGLAMTADRETSVNAFDQVVMNYLSFSAQTGPSMKALLSEDPDMPMARCIRGYFMMLMGVGALVGRARQDAEWLAQNRGMLNPREILHSEALMAWATQSIGAATRIWKAISETTPRDVLAVKMAHFGFFYLGDAKGIRDVVAASLDHWSQDDDVRPYVMSMYAFGLEECGFAREAEIVGRDALSQQPNDPWGIHVVSHAMEATGRTSEGVAFIDATQDQWSEINNFRYHLTWHKALFRFEAGHYDQALADYDQSVFSESATEYLDICNDASMLLRLEFAGVDTRDRWSRVAAKAQIRIHDRSLAFADLHFMMALISSPDELHIGLAHELFVSMEQYAGSSAADAHVYQPAVVAAQSLIAFRDARYSDAAERLNSVLPDLHVIGGSNAQRDIFSAIVAEAAWRSGKDAPETAALLAARSQAYPHNSLNWDLYLKALEARGDTSALDGARRRREQIGE